MAKNKETAIPSPAKDKEERDYDAEHAFDTLSKAEEHKNDKHMMERVKKHAGRKMKAMKGLHELFGDKKDEGVKSTDDLRALRNKKAAERNMG